MATAATQEAEQLISLKEMTVHDIPMQLQLWVWVKFTIFLFGIFYAVSLIRVNVLGQTMKPIETPTTNIQQPREIVPDSPQQPTRQIPLKGLVAPSGIQRGTN